MTATATTAVRTDAVPSREHITQLEGLFLRDANNSRTHMARMMAADRAKLEAIETDPHLTNEGRAAKLAEYEADARERFNKPFRRVLECCEVILAQRPHYTAERARARIPFDADKGKNAALVAAWTTRLTAATSAQLRGFATDAVGERSQALAALVADELGRRGGSGPIERGIKEILAQMPPTVEAVQAAAIFAEAEELAFTVREIARQGFRGASATTQADGRRLPFTANDVIKDPTARLQAGHLKAQAQRLRAAYRELDG